MPFSRIYQIEFTQGQGSVLSDFYSQVELKHQIIQLLGEESFRVIKNGQVMLWKDVCDEFDLDYGVTNEIINLKMKINRLYSKLLK